MKCKQATVIQKSQYLQLERLQIPREQSPEHAADKQKYRPHTYAKKSGAVSNNVSGQQGQV